MHASATCDYVFRYNAVAWDNDDDYDSDYDHDDDNDDDRWAYECVMLSE